MAKVCRKPADRRIIRGLSAELDTSWMYPVCADVPSPGSWHYCQQFDKWRLDLQCQPRIMIQQPGAEQGSVREGQGSFKVLSGFKEMGQDKMGCRGHVSNLLSAHFKCCKPVIATWLACRSDSGVSCCSDLCQLSFICCYKDFDSRQDHIAKW